MPVPNTFANVTTSIPLVQLDQNFATAITLGNTAIQLGNTVTTLNNMTLANVTISSGNTTVTSETISGNLTFTGTGNRILGDFSNATVANRVMFQSSTTNGNTVLNLIPNGTGTTCAFGMDTDPTLTNSSTGSLNLVASTDVRLSSGIRGTGTYLPMTFYTGGSERARIDTSGNVGIGTSSPSAFGGANLQVQNSSIASILWSNGTITGQLLCSSGAEVTVGSRSNHPLRFGTNDTERARIDTSGRLLLATTTTVDANAFMSIRNVNGTTGGIGIGNSVGSSDTNCITFFNSNGQVGRINTSGGATGYVTSSDYRLKENVQPMVGALAKVAALKPCTYKWKADGSSAEGFIAHELAEVCPGAVSGEKDAVNEDGSIKPQGIDTSFLVATLTAAIQEQQALITDLQTRLAALEGA